MSWPMGLLHELDRKLDRLTDNQEELMATLADVQANLDRTNATLDLLVTQEGNDPTGLPAGQVAVDQATIDTLATSTGALADHLATLIDPAVTPPVTTPPVITPPVTTPPVGTPPATP